MLIHFVTISFYLGGKHFLLVNFFPTNFSELTEPELDLIKIRNNVLSAAQIRNLILKESTENFELKNGK